MSLWIGRDNPEDLENVILAVIRSYVLYGDQRVVASRLGKTSAYVHQIVNRKNPSLPKRKATFVRLLDALRCTEADRRFLLTCHDLLYSEALPTFPPPGQILGRVMDMSLAEGATELRLEREWANYQANPVLALRAHQEIRDSAITLLGRAKPSDWAATAELCLLLYAVQCVLGQPGDALRYAKIARRTVEAYRENARRYNFEAENLLIGIAEAEAQAYYNLGQRNEAEEGLEEANHLVTTLREQHGEHRFAGYVYSSQINYLARFKPRVTAARNYHDSLLRECDVHPGTDRDKQHLLFIADTVLCRVYVASGTTGSYKGNMRRLFDKLLSQVEESHVGALQRVMFLRTHARYCERLGDGTGWASSIGQATEMAVAGGFNHQLRQIAHEYGERIVLSLQCGIELLPMDRLRPRIEGKPADR